MSFARKHCVANHRDGFVSSARAYRALDSPKILVGKQKDRDLPQPTKSCAELHLGLCVTRDADVRQDVLLAASRLHSLPRCGNQGAFLHFAVREAGGTVIEHRYTYLAIVRESPELQVPINLRPMGERGAGLSAETRDGGCFSCVSSYGLLKELFRVARARASYGGAGAEQGGISLTLSRLRTVISSREVRGGRGSDVADP